MRNLEKLNTQDIILEIIIDKGLEVVGIRRIMLRKLIVGEKAINKVSVCFSDWVGRTN